MIQVRLKLIANLRQFLPAGAQRGTCMLHVPAGSSIGELLERVGVPEPGGEVVLLNGRDARLDDFVQEGDTVAVFPRIAGG